MNSKLDFMLKEWGQWKYRSLEYGTELGENILHRCGFMMGTSGRPGHKILCLECNFSIRRIDRAFCALSDIEADALLCMYCLPHNPKTKKSYTQQELATGLGIKYNTFKSRIRRARTNLSKMLHSE